MCGGGGSSTPATTTQTTTQEPWPGVQEQLKRMYANAEAAYNQPGPNLYPFSKIPELSPETLYSQEYRRGFAEDVLPGMLTATNAGWTPLLNAADVQNNPYAMGAIKSAMQPGVNTLMQQVLPQIGSKALLEGAYSGERMPLAQSMAIEAGMRGIADSAAAQAGQLYGQGLEAQSKALALAPVMAQMGMLPANIMQDVGQEIEADQARRLGEAAQNYEYYQMLPYNKLAALNSILQGSANVGGTSTSSGTSMQQSQEDPMAAVMSGLMIAAMFAGSDRRIKRDVKRIGATPSGLPLYEFKYVWDDELRIGVMADEARERFPEAVIEGPDGYLLVNYAAIH